MKKLLQKFKRYKEIISALLIGIMVMLILVIAKNSATISELWSTTISRAIILISGSLSSVVPVSCYELFISFAIIGFIAFIIGIIRGIKKRDANKIISLFMALLLISIFTIDIYIMSASFAYNRAPLTLPKYSVEESGIMDGSETAALCNKLTEDINSVSLTLNRSEEGEVINPYTNNELQEKIARAFTMLDDNNYFSKYTPKFKPMLYSGIMNEMRLLGLTFAPFGEININIKQHPIDLPMTIAHEIAHAKGVMRENEANLVAIYVLINSDDNYLRYSALVFSYYYVNSIMAYLPDYNSELIKLNQSVNTDMYLLYNYYSQYNILSKISEFFNDIYLKLSGTSGTSSYIDNPMEVEENPTNPGNPDTPIYTINNYSDIQKLIFNYYLNMEN